MRRVKVVAHLAATSIALALSFASAAGAGASGDAAVGYWLTDTRDGIVEIRSCGAELCGYVHTILVVPEPGKPLVDGYNEDTRLRSRPLCGLPVLGKLQRVSADTWGNGWVYDPHAGKTYDVQVTVTKPDVLSILGYLGVKLLGQTVVWTRANSSFAKCQ